MKFSILIELLRFKTSQYKNHISIIGPIWINLDNEAFPDKMWFDFPIIILSWWLEELHSLVLNEQTIAECPFRDGPFHFNIINQGNENWAIEFFEHLVDEDKLLKTNFVSPKILISELLIVVKKVISFCEAKNWKSEDLEGISKLYLKYEKNLHNFVAEYSN